MDQTSREARLKADHEALLALDAASSILSLEATGDPPDRYTITFTGKGLGRDASASSEVTTIELHQIDLRMPYSYPNSPPDIRWITPILHPNVSFSGFVNLSDIGIVWTKEVPIDMLLERLWDVARAEFMNLNKATNYSAKNWFEKECQHALPMDQRPLRDQAARSGTNIVRYERRGPGQGVQFAGATSPSDVMFIDETTPTPKIPQRRPYVPVGQRRKSSGGDDVMYIGPEGE